MNHRAHVIGLQETRSFTRGVRTVGDFIVVSSLAAKGQFGCEIWQCTKYPIGKKGDRYIFVRETDVVIKCQGPRSLDIKVRTEIFILIISN